jgi:hypothetical protein
MSNLENVPLSQQIPRDRNIPSSSNSQSSQNSEFEDSFHLEELFDKNHQIEYQDDDPDLITFEELPSNNFETLDTLFESNDLDDFNNYNLEELARLQQPNIYPQN